jgi:sugar phosphate isomerase/epimerase
MKYAFMTFSTPDLALADVLEAARRYSYDGVELRIDGGHKHGVERGSGAQERAEARALARAHDVHICCIATGCRFADPAIADEHVAQALEAIDLAADVGAGVIRVFGGKVPDGVTREAAIAGARWRRAPRSAASTWRSRRTTTGATRATWRRCWRSSIIRASARTGTTSTPRASRTPRPTRRSPR